VISLQEPRPASGKGDVASGNVDVPSILQDGAPYDTDLDRFLLDLPVNGARSRNSVRAYAYDIMTWVRFLDEVRGISIWQACRADVIAYHKARRRGGAAARVSAQTWNRAVAALDKLYSWATQEGLAASSPFSYRQVLRRTARGGPALIVGRNTSYERAAERADVCPIALEDYVRFRDIGLRGLASDGRCRPGARDRNGTRNALFADLLVTTGLRLEEASSLLALEIEAALAGVGNGERQVPFRLAACLTKGDKGRTIRMPRRLLGEFRTYLAVERACAAEKFMAREGWKSAPAPILCRPGRKARRIELRLDGPRWASVSLDEITPDERRRLVLCDAGGAPLAPAALWLTEVGQAVAPNTWEVAFARASRRCHAAGIPIDVTPHQLRHTFSVEMLALLVRDRRDKAGAGTGDVSGDAYRMMLDEALQELRRMLGHASLATTYRYLNRLPRHGATADAAVEELLHALASWPGEPS